MHEINQMDSPPQLILHVFFFREKLSELRREKQKLVEKIMDQYRVLEPSMPASKTKYCIHKYKYIYTHICTSLQHIIPAEGKCSPKENKCSAVHMQ